MSAISNPKVTIQLTPANLVSAFEERRLLLLGQKTAAGTATSGALLDYVDDLGNGNLDTIKALLGETSELYNRFLMAIKGTERYIPIDIIPIDDDGSATEAEKIITFTGTATADGTLKIYLVDKYWFPVTLDILTGDTADDVGTALVSALADYDNFPMTPVNVSGAVTCTATNAGTVGDNYGVEIVGEVAGITAVITETAGATDPSLTSIFDVIGDERYTGIGWPEHWLDEIAVLTAFLEERFNPNNAILDGTGFIGRTDTFAGNKAFVDALNTQVAIFGGNNDIDTTTKKGGAILQPADYTMSYFMGVRAKRLTTDAPIADNIVATGGRLDAIGGPALASLPYFNTPLPYTPVSTHGEQYTELEQQELEESGFSVFGTNRRKSGVITGPMVTPYTNDSAGNLNESFHYLNYTDTGSVCREIFFNSLKARFSQSRLTEGTLIQGRNMANERSIKAALLDIYRVLANLALTQAGPEAEKYFSDNTTVTATLATRSATIDGPLPIVTQLGSIDYVLQFSFTVGSTGQQIVV